MSPCPFPTTITITPRHNCFTCHYMTYDYYVISCKFFTPTGLRDGKFPWFYKTLLIILAGLNNAVAFIISIRPPISPYQAFVDRSKCANINWYHHHRNVPQISLFPNKRQVLFYHFTFFDFKSMVSWDRKVHNTTFYLFIFHC